jgi:5-formaminoimidazole-4-carboxamide-1-beta-D-ribofuranosyl 5'-monophosphate synthetase
MDEMAVGRRAGNGSSRALITRAKQEGMRNLKYQSRTKMERAWRASVSKSLQIRHFKLHSVVTFLLRRNTFFRPSNTFVHHVGVGLSKQFLGQDLERIRL